MGDALIDGDPQRLGGYWLAGRVGEGGQGVVYEGYDAQGERVAIKVLRGDPSTQPRLAKEAAAARRVPAFCTARVLDADLEGPRPYIVSEYVEGPSLRQAARLFRGDELHRLATAIATALTAIHDAGVVHRDLKPDNVLLGPDGPRVIDFGVARTLEMSLTSAQLLAGTPGYMAPEAFSGERVGMPADVFAWGATALFAASGQDPFRADSLGAVMHRVLSHEPDLSALPDPVRSLVAAALAKDPRQRPTSRELLLALVSGDGLDTARLLAQGAGSASAMGAHGAPHDPALGTLAEDAYAALGPAERDLVPELFLRLVTVTDHGDLSVRQAARAELPAGIDTVLDRFAYLVSGGDPVRLLRPALPLAWPRLRAWIQAEKDGLAVHRRIATAAGNWASGGRREADLFHGSTLDDAQRWAAAGRRNITLTPDERDFLEAGAALVRRRGRRFRVISVALAVLLVLALAAGGFAVQQSRQVAAQRDVAESGRLAALADSVRAKDPVLGMLLGVAAHRVAGTPQARAAMYRGLTSAATRSFTDPAAVAERALSRDGRRLFSASDGEVRVWDMVTGRKTAAFRHQAGKVLRMAASPSGRTLAVATDKGGLRLWNAVTGAALRPRLEVYTDVGDFNVSYSWSEDVVVVVAGQGVTFWNTRTGARSNAATLGGPMEVPADGTAVVRALMGKGFRQPLPSGESRTLWRGCEQCNGFALSRDGRTLAVPGREQDLVLRDARTGKDTRTENLSPWNGGTVSWSGDGRLIASLGTSGLQVWQVGEVTPVLDEPVAPGAMSLAFDPDGHTLRYLARDTVISVELDLEPPKGPKATLLSPDGARLLSGRQVRTLATGAAITLPADPSSHVFSRNGAAIATTGESSVFVHDTTTGRRTAELPLRGESAQGLAFSPDGTRLAVSTQTYLSVVDLAGDRQVWRRRSDLVSRLAFTPDGRYLATDESFLDAATGHSATPQPLGKGVRGLGFSTEGAFFGRPDGSTRLAYWRQGMAAPSSAPLRDLPAEMEPVFSADGSLVATVDAGVRVYDVASGAEVATIKESDVAQVAFSAGGLLAIVEGKLVGYPLDPALVAAKVCAKAGRSLSAEEWAEYVPGLPYREVCPG
ncbi:WD40 repeat domain-containing serine/threonine-protein kinase [Nonomuraea sp. NPDC049152]|uniref:WD40 repeat domain-containing serine/threonine-protein kinase n=1 Tax=Nonomuraea sp. NPDC049152 TaxID=3154350 RepID=UPI0033E32943